MVVRAWRGMEGLFAGGCDDSGIIVNLIHHNNGSTTTIKHNNELSQTNYRGYNIMTCDNAYRLQSHEVGLM